MTSSDFDQSKQHFDFGVAAVSARMRESMGARMAQFSEANRAKMLKPNELRLNHNFLDTDFEGYKLSLTPIPTYKEDIPNGVNVVQPSEDQFSFLHQRLFSLHNHLVADPWNVSSVFFVDASKKIYRSWIGVNGRLEKSFEVMQIPYTRSEPIGNIYNISMDFPSSDTCVLTDGAGSLYIIETSNRSSGDIVPWKILYEGQPLGCNIPSTILDARAKPGQLLKEIHCILQYVAPSTSKVLLQDKKTPGFETVLSWVRISEDVDGSWSVQTEELRGQGAVDYLAVEPSCEGVYIASEANFKFSKAEEMQPVNGTETNVEDDTYDFEWEQSFDTILITLDVQERGEDTNREVEINCESTKLDVRANGESLLNGTLAGAVVPSLYTYKIVENKLEIVLEKYHKGTMWQTFIISDKKGKEIINCDLVEEVNRRLASLTSDKEEQANVVLNTMEECDGGDEESRTLQRFTLEGLKTTNRVHLGSQQWLLVGPKGTDRVAPFCIRNDVDGCVWAPGELNVDSGEWKIDHVGTLLAFGYIQASKTSRKFSILSPGFSYIAIVDVSGHVIVYRKGIAVNSTLRNRKTGRQTREIAVQQLVNLQTSSLILGAAANNEHIFILTRDALHLLHVD
ncbi:CS domain [Nesidiocoris tenuis]|uniref:NudC domain-containing protein 1 n=1 Tax=Nesidiocoris tenuis TaxID=355587 RepID=A0ABN7AJS4_9HEMI|nr:CS domain [Nesidiocoris tenuis]